MNVRINKIPSNQAYPAHTATYSSIITILLAICVLLVPVGAQNQKKSDTAGFIIDLNQVVRFNQIDAGQKELGRLFARISGQMKTANSPLKTQELNFSALDIEFLPGQSDLNLDAQNFLRKYAENLQQTRSAGRIKLYISAAADDVNDIKQRAILSAQRAYRVETFLKSVLPAGFNCPIYSVGTAAKRTPAQTSQVLVAVLQNEKD